MVSDKVDTRVAGIIRKLDKVYFTLREPEPSPQRRLFHFTDASGLVGIISSGKLWASNADFLNDSSEPAHALGVLRAAFQKAARSFRPGSTAERARSVRAGTGR